MKTTVVKGVLTSHELMITILFRCVFDRAATISFGSDAVTDPISGRIITPLPHDIAQLLTSPRLNCNHSICRRCRFVVVVTIPFCCFVFISTLGNAVYSLRLRAYCCVHWERGLPILVCFGSHYKLWKLRSAV